VKIRFNNGGQQGSVLLITLAVLFIIGLGFASYLTLVQSQHRLVAESQAWNTALTLAEAGIEEGMAQINIVLGTNYTSSTATNWGGPTGGVYGPRTNTMTNGSYSTIIIQGTPSPTIISTGYAVVPFNSVPIQRVVQVTTTNVPAFGLAMGVQQDITTKGNNMMVDSYDSADPLHSTNGMYYAPTHKAGGDIASIGGLVNIQNANIYGKLKTGPGGSYSIGANGTVGDLNWNVPGQIQPGWYKNDFNAIIKDVGVPFTSGFSVTQNGSGTNTYILGSGDYYVNGDLVLSQNENLYVSGDTRLYVTGNINMKSQNNCRIIIAAGASLKLYCGTPDGSAVSAELTQVNTAGNASTFQYWGLPSNNSLTWNGNNVYVGTVYAPQAAFSCGGGGSTDFDYQGSCVVYSVWLNGHFNFHFDENLTRLGPPTGFTITSWKEL
jgi:hypothetical protein